MNSKQYAQMAEITQLTREGRLREATLLIQRALGSEDAHAVNATELTAETLRLTAAPAPVSPETDAHTSTAAEDESPTVTARPAAEPRGEASRQRRAPQNGRARTHRPSARRTARPPFSGMPTGRFCRPDLRPVPPGGQWIAGTHTNAAGTRGYKLYIPSAYHGQAMPLVVMLHGCTQDPDDFASGTGMNFVAEDEGFFVAYPAQTACANASKCWNWFQATHQQRDKGETALLAGITRHVTAEYRLDSRRIYVAGLSAGGAMAAILAANYPDLYAAVGVHSGLAPGCAHDLPSALAAMQRGSPGELGVGCAVPLILFHGDRDTTVHPANAEQLLRQWTGKQAAGEGGAIRPATIREGRAAGGRTYTCALHRDAHGNVVVEQWTIHGAGHSWSGGSPSGSYTDPSGPDASRQMARFFHEHPRKTIAPPPAH